MLSFLKRRREKAERKAKLQDLGRVMGESLNAELELYIQMQLVPTRHAYMEVLSGQLATIDERIAEMVAEGELELGELGQEEAAAADVRLMMDNWDERSGERLQAAHEALREELEIAEQVGVADQYRAAIEEALIEQRMILLTDGMGAINKLMGR